MIASIKIYSCRSKNVTYSILLEKQNNNNNEKLLLEIFFSSPESLTENKQALKCLGILLEFHINYRRQVN